MRSPLLECYWLVWSQHLTPSGPWGHALEPLVQAGIEIGIQFRRDRHGMQRWWWHLQGPRRVLPAPPKSFICSRAAEPCNNFSGSCQDKKVRGAVCTLFPPLYPRAQHGVSSIDRSRIQAPNRDARLLYAHEVSIFNRAILIPVTEIFTSVLNLSVLIQGLF